MKINNNNTYVNSSKITLEELNNIVNSLPPSFPQEVNGPLPSIELLSKEYYDPLFNNYIEYMSTMLNN